MINKRTMFRFLIISLLILISGCSAFQAILHETVQRPSVKFGGASLSSISFDGVEFLFDVNIENPNRMGIKLAGIQSEFFVNGSSLVKSDRQGDIEIKPRGTSTVQIPVSLTFADLYDLYENLRKEGSADYLINCILSFELPVVGIVRVPISKNGNFPLLKRPSVEIGGIDLKKLGMTGADLNIKIKIGNPNAFSMILDSFSYRLEIAGNTWSSGRLVDAVRLTEEGENIIDIPIRLDFIQVGHSIYEMLTDGRKLDYRFSGNLGLQTSIPLLKNVELPFDRTGEVEIRR